MPLAVKEVDQSGGRAALKQCSNCKSGHKRAGSRAQAAAEPASKAVAVSTEDARGHDMGASQKQSDVAS